jgi:hypothetical protein
MLCNNLLTGLIAAILSLSLSCDSYGKNYASRKGCEMPTQKDAVPLPEMQNDDYPFPPRRPYNRRLPPSDPGNQRSLQGGEQGEEDTLYGDTPPALPRRRPYNPQLPQDEPGNERAIRADLQPILEAFGNWGKALERQEQEGQQERNRRYQPHQPLPNPLGLAQGGATVPDYHGGYHGGNEPPLCPCRKYEPITLIFLLMNLVMYGPGKDYEKSKKDKYWSTNAKSNSVGVCRDSPAPKGLKAASSTCRATIRKAGSAFRRWTRQRSRRISVRSTRSAPPGCPVLGSLR